MTCYYTSAVVLHTRLKKGNFRILNRKREFNPRLTKNQQREREGIKGKETKQIEVAIVKRFNQMLFICLCICYFFISINN